MAAIADMPYLNASASYGQPEAYQHCMPNGLHSTAALATQSLPPTTHSVSILSHPASPADIATLLLRILALEGWEDLKLACVLYAARLEGVLCLSRADV